MNQHCYQLKTKVFRYSLSHLVIVLPVDVPVVHGLAAGLDDAGEVDSAAGLDEQLVRAKDGRAGF